MMRPVFDVIEDFGRIPVRLKGAAVAIGNFDGVHRGHQHLFAHLIQQARTLGVPAVALTFEPHPRELFQRGEPLLRLGSVVDKARVLRAIGLDGMAVLRFDAALAAISPEDFVQRFLLQGLAASSVMVGENFRFGKNRVGGTDFLNEEGRRLGFAVRSAQLLIEDGQPISSSRVRAALQVGEMQKAHELLGYHWFTRATRTEDRYGQIQVTLPSRFPLVF